MPTKTNYKRKSLSISDQGDKKRVEGEDVFLCRKTGTKVATFYFDHLCDDYIPASSEGGYDTVVNGDIGYMAVALHYKDIDIVFSNVVWPKAQELANRQCTLFGRFLNRFYRLFHI